MRDMPVPDPISVRGLTYRTGGSTLVADVSLDFTRGHVTAIMGPNGAGKSVLLRLIAGLISPDSGSSVSEERIALVFQRPVLLRRPVSANLDHALRTHGISRKDRPARLSELMKICDLQKLAKHPARRLSGGEQQRVAMARAFAGMPTLLLLDEPTASLDPTSTARIEALISQAAADGIAVVLVTHDAGQARRIADTVAFLHKGHLTEHTSVSQFFPQPASAEARAYLAGDLLT